MYADILTQCCARPSTSTKLTAKLTFIVKLPWLLRILNHLFYEMTSLKKNFHFKVSEVLFTLQTNRIADSFTRAVNQFPVNSMGFLSMQAPNITLD